MVISPDEQWAHKILSGSVIPFNLVIKTLFSILMVCSIAIIITVIMGQINAVK